MTGVMANSVRQLGWTKGAQTLGGGHAGCVCGLLLDDTDARLRRKEERPPSCGWASPNQLEI